MAWLQECSTDGKTITDAAIREKAKSLVPELVLSGTFKASAGWLDNFKQRNGIRHGRWDGSGTRALDERAVGLHGLAEKAAEAIDTSGTLDARFPESFLEEQGVLPLPNAATSNTSNPSPDQRAPERDVEMGEERSFSSADSSVGPHNWSGAQSGASSPVVAHETEAAHDSVVATPGSSADLPPVQSPAGDQVMAYNQDPLDPFPPVEEPFSPAYRSANPDGPIFGGRGTAVVVRGPSEKKTPAEVEESLDDVLDWVEEANVLNDGERDTLQRIKMILLDSGASGIIDRSRYPAPS